jgi:restriction system protein
MAVPDFQSLLLPLLEALENGETRRLSELYELLAERFELSSEDRKEMLPSGRQSRFKNRVAWAKVYWLPLGELSSKSLPEASKGNAPERESNHDFAVLGGRA